MYLSIFFLYHWQTYIFAYFVCIFLKISTGIYWIISFQKHFFLAWIDIVLSYNRFLFNEHWVLKRNKWHCKILVNLHNIWSSWVLYWCFCGSLFVQKRGHAPKMLSYNNIDKFTQKISRSIIEYYICMMPLKRVPKKNIIN